MIRIADYRFRETAARLIARFGAIAAADRRAESLARKANRVAWWILAGCGACWVSLPFWTLIKSDSGFMTAAAAGFVTFPLAAMARCYAWYQRSRYDLDDRKVAFVPAVLEVLGADIPASEPVELAIDFRMLHRTGRVRREWLALGTRLADGSRLRLAVTERGKIKRKYKRRGTLERGRLSERLTLVARLEKHHGSPAELGKRLKAVKPPEPLKASRVAHRAGAVRVDLDGPVWSYSNAKTITKKVPLTPEHVLKSLVWFYGALRPRRGVKR